MMLLHGLALVVWLGYWMLLLVSDLLSIFYFKPGKAVSHASSLLRDSPPRTPGTHRRRRPASSPMPHPPSPLSRESSRSNIKASPTGSANSRTTAGRWPGVTLVKPVKGEEPCLQSNLESFFQLTYPEYEIIIAVDDPQDPAKALAEKLMEAYPHVQARVSIASREDDLNSVNPKIRNMAAAFQMARHDLIWASDSNTFVSDNALFELVGYTIKDRRIGMVHQLPLASAPPYPCFSSYIESLYLCTAMSRPYMFANLVLHMNCAMGKSMLLRKHVLDRRGGITAYARYLAEDYYIGKTFLDEGMLIKLAREPVHQCVCDYSFKVFTQRRIRWSRLRMYTVPLSVLMEPFSQSVPSGMVAAFALSGYLMNSYVRVAILFLHFFLWFMCDVCLLRRLTTTKDTPSISLDFDQWSYLVWAWIVREVTYLPLFVTALCGRQVIWRGNLFRLSPRGKVVRLSSGALPKPDAVPRSPLPSRPAREKEHSRNPLAPNTEPSSLHSQDDSAALLTSLTMPVTSPPPPASPYEDIQGY
jgi:ceramide glucosyltransferase